DGEAVAEIYLQRIVHSFTKLERRRRSRWHDDGVHPFERLFIVAPDQGSHLLRLQVIRVVVPGTENVGPQHDAALDLRPESLRARSPVHRDEIVVRSFDPQSETHSVVAREVRTGFSRGDEVVHRYRRTSVGKLDVDERGAAGGEDIERFSKRR